VSTARREGFISVKQGGGALAQALTLGGGELVHQRTMFFNRERAGGVFWLRFYLRPSQFVYATGFGESQIHFELRKKQTGDFFTSLSAIRKAALSFSASTCVRYSAAYPGLRNRFFKPAL
jgi:hypothetical protein